MFGSTLIAWARASGLESPMLVRSRTEPCRAAPPPRASRPSSRLVLPLWNGPTIAINRGPDTRCSAVAPVAVIVLSLGYVGLWHPCAGGAPPRAGDGFVTC